MNTTVFVLSMVNGKPKWSRYLFPFSVDDYAQLGNDLYMRDANAVRKINVDVNYDETVVDGEPTRVYYDGIIQWPWLDLGTTVDKQMIGFDLIGTGIPTVQFGYSQANPSYFTDEYDVDPDTLEGGIIAMPLCAPSLSPKITYKGAEGNFWKLDAMNLYFK